MHRSQRAKRKVPKHDDDKTTRLWPLGKATSYLSIITEERVDLDHIWSYCTGLHFIRSTKTLHHQGSSSSNLTKTTFCCISSNSMWEGDRGQRPKTLGHHHGHGNVSLTAKLARYLVGLVRKSRPTTQASRNAACLPRATTSVAHSPSIQTDSLNTSHRVF